MMKKLPAWIVLTVISLVAALALGATYNGTKDRIAAQEAEKAVAVRQELLPEAADFEQVKLLEHVDGISGATITSEAVFKSIEKNYVKLEEQGVKAGTVKSSSMGYADFVGVEMTTDENGLITDIKIGDEDFAETDGLGARALEPAFAQQFIGLGRDLSVDNTGDAQVFRGVDANGSAAGYVSTGTVTGFGGPVEVTVGTDAAGVITGVRVGGANFQETAGLGAKAKEPAFYEQFAGKEYPVDLTKNGGEIDAITAATITSSAVVRGVNDTIKNMSAVAGFKINEPVVLVDELGNNRYATSKQGFGGPVYVELEVVDGAITDIVIGDDRFNETSGYGAGAREESFYGQYIGKGGTGLTLNTDVDQISGATITSNAVNDAVNMILLYVNDPEAFAAQIAAAGDAPDVSIPEGAETWTAEAKGLTGTFDVTISVDENAAVSGIRVGDASADTDAPFLSQVKDNAAFLSQFIGTTGNVSAADIDAVAGATISSNGVVEAVNKAYNQSQGIVEEEPAPAEEPASPAEAVTGTEYKVKGQGLSDTFPVVVTLDESGAVAAVKVKDTDSEYDAPFLAQVQDNEAFLNQFIGKTGAVAESDIDLVSGATISSQGVLAAVNEVLANAVPAEEPAEAPAEEPAPAAEAVLGTEYKVKGQGLSDTFPVVVTLDESGAVAAVKVKDTDSEYDASFLAQVQDNEAFLNQFIGKTGAVAESDIDLVSGATISSQGVLAAVNEVLANAVPAEEPAEAPAEEPAPAAEAVSGTEYKVKGQGLSDTFPVVVTLDESGAVAAVKVKDTDSEYDAPFLAQVQDNEAFLNQFIGKTGAVAESDIDLVSGATISSQGVLAAVNEVLASAVPAEAPAEEPAEAPAEEPAEAPAEEPAAALRDGVYATSVQGYTDQMYLIVTLQDGVVADVTVQDSNSATDAPFVSKVQEEAFLSQFTGAGAPVAADSMDAVSGATASSEAVLRGVNRVLEAAAQAE